MVMGPRWGESMRRVEKMVGRFPPSSDWVMPP